MSAKPGEELGSDGRWFSDEYERNGLFDGEQKPRGGEAAGDLDQQLHPFQDDGKRPTVAMETASTGKTDSCRSKVLLLFFYRLDKNKNKKRTRQPRRGVCFGQRVRNEEHCVMLKHNTL